jgi:hypothetical protein
MNPTVRTVVCRGVLVTDSMEHILPEELIVPQRVRV